MRWLCGQPNGEATLKLSRAELAGLARDAAAEAMILMKGSCPDLRRNLQKFPPQSPCGSEDPGRARANPERAPYVFPSPGAAGAMATPGRADT